MPDIIDDAQDMERMAREANIASVRACLPSGHGRETCRECGIAIPLARREALPGVELCIRCQAAKEDV